MVLSFKTPIFFGLFLILVSVGILFPAAFSYAAVVHKVPFTSQAPFGDWSEPYKNFCEEASIAMVAHFIWGVPLSSKIADLEMRIIQKFEQLVFGRAIDNNAEDVALVLKTLYGFKNVFIKEISSEKDIIGQLDTGKVLIAPVAGRMLKNPYFTPPGPIYHILVIKGYDEVKKTFITNDPGTRRGENFSYGQKLLYEAIHDWNGGKVMGGKKMVVSVGK